MDIDGNLTEIIAFGLDCQEKFERNLVDLGLAIRKFEANPNKSFVLTPGLF